MKLALTAAVALISLSVAGAAYATPSLSYVSPQADIAGAEFVDAKIKFKKFGHNRGFRRGHFGGSRRGHFGGSRFGHRSFGGNKYGHFGNRNVRKDNNGKKFFFGKGVFLK